MARLASQLWLALPDQDLSQSRSQDIEISGRMTSEHASYPTRRAKPRLTHTIWGSLFLAPGWKEIEVDSGGYFGLEVEIVLIGRVSIFRWVCYAHKGYAGIQCSVKSILGVNINEQNQLTSVISESAGVSRVSYRSET